MKKENVLNILLSVGMVILLLSAFLPLVDVKTPWLRYIFTFAAMLIVVVRVFQRAARRKQTFSLRVRRLFTMEFWSAMCYVVSALFLFSDPIPQHVARLSDGRRRGAGLRVVYD